MSFNPNDNAPFTISRSNYEEYFLLYADNELKPEERLQVEQFVLAHPDLQPELDLLLSTQLPIENINLGNKESLLAESMKLNAIDEALLLYIDDELNEAEKKLVEEKLKTDKAYQLQYNFLLLTKPTGEKVIAYPYKKELYRYEVKRNISFYWMRIAAAIIILAGLGIFVFTRQQGPVTPPIDRAVAKDQQTRPASDNGKEQASTKIGKTKPVQPPLVKTGETDDVPNVVRHLKKRSPEKTIKKQIMVSPVEKEEPEVIVHHEARETEEKNEVVRSKPEIPSQQTINKTDVTSSSTASYNNQTASPVTAVHTDFAKTDNEKKSTLKGFLRKATRFIERRTNISTTNENDELLIGAVSVKL